MITVLRLGHRTMRDQRITTHCALVSRAFGADACTISGEQCEAIIESVKKVASAWGGDFKVEYEKNWKKTIKEFNGTKVHLTIYGLPIQKEIQKIRQEAKNNLLIIIGGEKVPPEVYQMADYNISVTNQPHSEVAALAVFLHEFFEGRELEKKFPNPKVHVEPAERAKRVYRNGY